MQKSSFCISTGKCVANAYRKVAEGTAQFRTFFGKVIRAAMEQFRSSCRQPAEDGQTAEAAAPEKSPEQMDAVFTHAMCQLQNPDPVVRAAALRVFERLGKTESVSRAAALLSDPDADVRAQAQEVLHLLNPVSGQTP